MIKKRLRELTTFHPLSHSQLSCESIPGCVLQVYVWLDNPTQAGTYALLSILISSLTTGFTSAMISFEIDNDKDVRKLQPKFAGFIPNKPGIRGFCFGLMTLISTLHNLSRTVGFSLLALQRPVLLFYFVAGEALLYNAFKISRGDFIYWLPIEGVTAVFVALVQRVLIKLIADFTGCLQFRHPNELGGAAFAASMLWAQAFPFVALQFYDEGESDKKRFITIFFVCSFVVWIVLVLLLAFYVDRSYLHTFYDLQTGPESVIERFLLAEDDFSRYDAAFQNRSSYTKPIRGQIKAWVADNIDRWR